MQISRLAKMASLAVLLHMASPRRATAQEMVTREERVSGAVFEPRTETDLYVDPNFLQHDLERRAKDLIIPILVVLAVSLGLTSSNRKD